ncbi:MAG: group II intron reverse transcriptase domain-containing protein [Nitrospinae bacterium]|nr:group II intron reverse transcriptase domain-containing protein [Nitrospinota bacterium]
MPKTYNALFEKIYTFDNLYNAYLKARRCKRYKKEVLEFSSNIEEELFVLQSELMNGGYKTGQYRKFVIHEPKRRVISALPFRDRVIHHALCTVIEPLLEKKFINDSYACRSKKGTHASSNRLVEFLRRAQRKWNTVYCLKADISKFFPSVDHEALKNIIRRTIRCKRTLMLIDEIVDSADGDKGLPIGNLTSQLFANVYLNELDHFVKEKLQVKFYIRYMDDFVLLHSNKKQLHLWKVEIGDFLMHTLRLQLNYKTSVFPISHGVDFVGYRTWPTHRLLRKRSFIRMRRKLKKFVELYKHNKITLEKIKQSITSWLGHVKHSNSYNVVKRVFGGITFSKN